MGGPIIYFWFVSCVAETSRTPFDFAEGESELVSGFNVEYGGVGFALIFMAEYAIILFFRGLSACLAGGGRTDYVLFSFFTRGFAFLWVWLRASFPRYRYDLLMRLAWKHLLPSVLSVVLFIILISRGREYGRGWNTL